MSRIVLEEPFSNRLSNLIGVTEICDPSGKLLGKFVPALDLSGWEPVMPEVTEEELDKREQDTEWLTTQEMLDYLREQEKS